MWIPTPAEIRRRRQELGLTQRQVAERAGVSQPLIARIERGSVDPRSSTLGRILAVLNAAGQSTPVVAREVMSRPLVSIRSKDSLRRAAFLMNRGGYSQLPVVEDARVVGTITERRIVEEMGRAEDLEGLSERSVGNFLQPAPPHVPPEEPLESLSHLLDAHPLVVVAIGGRPVGVVTKSDLIRRLGQAARARAG